MTIRIVSCCLMSLGLVGCASLREFHAPPATQRSAACDLPTDLNSLCQSLLDSAINEHGLVGAQLSLSIGDDLRCNFSSGTTDPDRHQPMLPTHLIRIGSLTKTYTAVIILRLMERGLFELDSPIARWFPQYRFSKRITIRMLLDHSSGIREILGPRVMMLSTIKSRRVWTTPELLSIIFGPELEFEPGSDHRYSNSNYILLGILAERASGKPLETLYREEIFTPLDMHHTWFLLRKDSPDCLVTGFDRDLISLPGWHKNKPDNSAWSSLACASGGMAATASDVMRFFEAMMRREIISDESYRIMTAVEKTQHPKDKYLEDFGSGLFRDGDFYRGAYGHMGLFVGSEAIALFDQEKRFVVLLLANVSRIKNKDTLIQGFLDVIKTHLGGQQRHAAADPARRCRCRC